MTFSTLLPPCVARFDIDKALCEIKIENKGDLPSKKSISRNPLSETILAFFLSKALAFSLSDFYILFTSQSKF